LTSPAPIGTQITWKFGNQILPWTRDTLIIDSAGTYRIIANLAGCIDSATFKVSNLGSVPSSPDTIIHKSPGRNNILVYPESGLCYKWGYYGNNNQKIHFLTDNGKQHYYLGATFLPNRKYFVEIRYCIDSCFRTIDRMEIDSGDVDLAPWRTAVSPNPSSGLFQVSVLLAEPATLNLRVFDITGRPVIDPMEVMADPELVIPVDLTSAASGMYYLILETADGNYRSCQRLIVTH
jgi:hypothetical protein